MPRTRDQVLAAALRLLDDVGADKLTMRRLATELDLQNGATYWHFPSKQALFEAMADAMLAGLTTDLDTTAPWPDRITELGGRLRRALSAHRDGARIFSSVFFPLPHALAYGDAMIGILRDAGFADREAAWATDSLTYFVVGHTIEEQAATGLPDHAAAVERLTAALDPAAHPHLIAAIAHVPAPHPDGHFDYGLGLLVAGLRAHRAAEAVVGRTADFDA